MALTPLLQEECEAIVAHMNDDHSETIANYVRYFGGVQDVVSAELREITNHELYIDTVAHDLSCRLAVQLIRPVQTAGEARKVLVEMAKEARDGLRGEPPGSALDAS